MCSAHPQISKTGPGIRVCNPYDGALVGTVPETGPGQIGAIAERARRGADLARALPRHKRVAILEQAATLIGNDHDDFARLITRETGKTIRQARAETSRCINSLRLSAQTCRQEAGELVPFSAYAGSQSRKGWFTREPLGIILAITPYNDPLNLAAHKLGPAIAGGNAIILKPSELAPLSALQLVSVLTEAGLPDGIVTTAIGGAGLGKELVGLREVRMVSFTGGFAAGEDIAGAAGLKKLAMDLGGNAPVIVMADCDVDRALEATVSGAFWAAGQNCIGVQRILVEKSLYERFRQGFVDRTRALVVGDPDLDETDVGPMISPAGALRAEGMVVEALTAGARLLCGNFREGSLYQPTVLENVSHSCRLWTQEAFAPIALLQPFGSLGEAIALANDPESMLHAGIFTRNLDQALEAAERIEAGAVMINDSSDYRLDAMPFGGFKYGSMGREGVRFAYEEMTQPKVICINKG